MNNANNKAFRAVIEKIRSSVRTENTSGNEMFVRYCEIIEESSDGLIQFDREKAVENYIFEVSFFYLLCSIYSQAINEKFNLNIDYRCIASKLDSLKIYEMEVNCEDLDGQVRTAIIESNIELHNTSIVSELYEEVLDKEDKKRFGQFYTPSEISKYMVEDVKLVKENFSKELKIIDPACGAGVFLKEVIKIAKKKVQGLNLVEFCYGSLYGNDINPYAIILTKLNISFELINSLDNQEEAEAFLDKYICFENIKLKNTITEGTDTQFDYIIGNPPYFKIKKKDFPNNNYYKEVLFGQANIYTLFTYWALLHAKENAKISFIIPQSFRSGLYFRSLREKLYNLKLLSITNFKSRNKIFKDVEQAVVILTIQNVKKRNNSVNIVHIENTEISRGYQYKAEQRSIMLDKKYDFFFFIPEKKEMYDIIHKIYEGSTNQKTLDNNLSFGNGLYVWNQHKDILTNEFCNKLAPIIYCSSIDKNNFVYKQSPDKNSEKKLYSIVSEEVEKFLLEGKRLIIQRTSTLSNSQRIKSCIIDDLFLEKYPKYFLENHVNFLYNKLDKNANISLDELYFYEAILNSKVLNYVFRCKNGNTQVSATELNLLPIKMNLKNEIVKEQKEYKKKRDSNHSKEVEELIFYNYELTGAEIDLIIGSGD